MREREAERERRDDTGRERERKSEGGTEREREKERVNELFTHLNILGDFFQC